MGAKHISTNPLWIPILNTTESDAHTGLLTSNSRRTSDYHSPSHQHRHRLRFYKSKPKSYILIPTLFITFALTVFLYHTSPSFHSSADTVINTLSAYIPSCFRHSTSVTPAKSDLCTKQVGDEVCCALYLEAMPCVDVCRASFVHRDTMKVGEGYSECEEKCLVGYEQKCKGGRA